MAMQAREEFSAGSDRLFALKGGGRKPPLVLHEELGHPGRLGWHETLSRRRTLLIPLQPGFGQTPRVEWVMNVRDLACLYARFLRDQRLQRKPGSRPLAAGRKPEAVARPEALAAVSA